MRKRSGIPGFLLLAAAALRAGGAVFTPPPVWEGDEAGTTRGFEREHAGAVWRLEQVFPADPEDAGCYRPLTWTGSQWFNAENSQGGQPAVSIKDGAVVFGVRARGGGEPRWEHVRAAALSFVAPQAGLYRLDATVDVHRWEGGVTTQFRVYRRSGREITPVARPALKPAKGNVVADVRVLLEACDALVIVPFHDGYHSGATVTVRDLRIERLGEAEGRVAAPPAVVAPVPPPGGVVNGREWPANAGQVDARRVYGARGDGVADDTDALQRAIDEQRNRGGRVIHLPAGVYLVSRTLTYGADLEQAKFLAIQGEGPEHTVIRLKDNAEGFGDPARPRPVLTMFEGKTTGMAFNNSIYALTIDTGRGNPGAIALQWMNNNTGGAEDLVLRSGDPGGAGIAGLDLTRHEPGPALFRRVTIEGFDTGIDSVQSCFSLTFEHLTLRHQRRVGVRNTHQTLFFRDLRSENRVPVIDHRGGYGAVIVHDSFFAGGDPAQPAILCDNHRLVLRNVRCEGYARLAAMTGGGKATVAGLAGIEGRAVDGDWFALLPEKRDAFGDGPARMLGLPVEEPPEIPHDPLERWIVVNPERMAADHDIAPAVQEAVDHAAARGLTTVVIPGGASVNDRLFGGTVRIHGSVRRVTGMDQWIGVTAAMAARRAPLFRVEDGAGAVAIERMFLTTWGTERKANRAFTVEHASRRPLVLRHMSMMGAASDGGPYVNTVAGGKVFVDDTVGAGWLFRGQRVWMRQYNPESNEPMTINDGGDLWVFGSKTESAGGTWFVTRRGGRTELLGGYNYPSWRREGMPAAQPLFIVEDGGRLAATYKEQSFFGHQEYAIQLAETRDGQTRFNRREALTPGKFAPLLVAGPTPAPAQPPKNP